MPLVPYPSDANASDAEGSQRIAIVPAELRTDFPGYAGILHSEWAARSVLQGPPKADSGISMAEVSQLCLDWHKSQSADADSMAILRSPRVFLTYVDVRRHAIVYGETRPASYVPLVSKERLTLAVWFIDCVLPAALRLGGQPSIGVFQDRFDRAACILRDPLMLSFVSEGVWTQCSGESIADADRAIKSINDRWWRMQRSVAAVQAGGLVDRDAAADQDLGRTPQIKKVAGSSESNTKEQ